MIKEQIQTMVEHLETDGPMMAGLVDVLTDALEHIKDLEAEIDNAENYSISCPECGKYIG